MDLSTRRLIAEADHLVRRARWIADAGLPSDTHAAGRCRFCQGWIAATNARDWGRAVSGPCPHCGARGW